MKKRLLALLLTFLMVLSLIPNVAFAAIEDYPIPDYGVQAQGDAAQKFANGEVLSVAHRAAWRHGPENSLLSIAAAIEIGVDVVELDVALTKDKVLVLSHDATINRCVAGMTGKVSDYTWDELSSTQLEPRQGGSDKAYSLTESDVQILNSLSNYAEHSGGAAKVGGTLPLTRMDDAIELIDHRAMINLDKCTTEEVFIASYILFRETNMLDHVFFKNSVNGATLSSWCQSAADAWNEKHPDEPLTKEDVQKSFIYVYVLSSSNTEALQGHLNAGNPLKMVEFVISNATLEKSYKAVDEVWCKENNIAMFINTMWAGLADTRPDSENCWAEMIDRGYTAIQTDRPSELVTYLTETFRTDRTSDSTIEAEHFSNFSYANEYTLSVPAESDSNLNKTVGKIANGEWLAYDNIVFDGEETFISLSGRGLIDAAFLQVYLDEITSDNLIAEKELTKSSSDQIYTAALTKTVAAGKHTIYLKFSGAPRTSLASLDNFSFGNGSSIAANTVIEPMIVTTEPGTAPKLPSSVNVNHENITYSFDVKWESISSSAYSEEGHFTVLGYVNALKDYVSATVAVTTVDPAITEDGLVLWLDAADITDKNITAWPAKDGYGNDATLKNGSFSLKDVGRGKGLYFDGSSALDLVLDEGFWNGKSEFTVIIYNAPEMTTGGNNNAIRRQYNSVLYFTESATWGSTYFTPSQNEIMWRFGNNSTGDYGATYVRPITTGSSYSGTAFRKDGTDDAVFVDGTKIYSGKAISDTTANISSKGYIGVGNYNNYYKGTVCEILIYNRALTDLEIASAQKYLSEKYLDENVSYESIEINTSAGEIPILPSTVKATYESGTTVDMGVAWESIDPRLYVRANTFEVEGVLANGDTVTAKIIVTGLGNISFDDMKENMLVWFSAASLNGENDAPVSEWIESSGNSTDAATQTNEDNQPSLVVNDDGTVAGVYFDGADKMTFSMDDKDLLNDLSEATAIIYSKPEKTSPTGMSTNHNSSVVYFGETSEGWGGVYIGTFTNGVAGRFGNGTDQYRGILYKSGSYNGYTTAVMTKNGSEHEKLYINGEEITNLNTSSGSGTAPTANNDATKGVLGQGKNNTYWQGTVSEIMIFDHALSEEELALVYEYLDKTYNKTESTVTEDGLLLWLDASEGLDHTDGSVTGWVNKADVSQIATVKSSTAPEYVEDAINGKGGVVFDGSTSLQITLDSGALNDLEGGTIIAYANTNTQWLTNQETSNGAYWRAQRKTLVYAPEKGGSWGSVYMGVYTDYLSARFGTGTNNDNGCYYKRDTAITGYTSTATVWDGTNKTYTLVVDGNTVGSGSSLGTSSKNNSNVLYIGEGKDTSAFGGWDGTLTELLIYGRALSDSELQSVIKYLDEKYTPEVAPVYVNGVYLKEENTRTELNVDDEQELCASTIPADADNDKLIYESSAPDVVSVDQNGKITAISKGFAVITVTTDEGRFYASCVIKVVMNESESLWEDIHNLTIWANNADSDSYDDWSSMEQALSSADGVNAESSIDVLNDTYTALRNAKIGLTVKGHTHSYADPFVVTNSTYEKAGLELLICKECGATESREIPILENPAIIFTDVADSDWYKEAVYYVANRGIMGGVGSGRFDPEGTTTRAMVVQVLYNMEGKPDVSSVKTPFTDIAGEWYEAAVKWAYSSEVVNGMTPTTFNPKGKITREQFATILYRYSAYKGYSVSERADLSAYKDAAKISAYAKDAMSWANALGYIGGMTATTLVPTGNATRAQMAQIMTRFLKNIK